MNIHQWMSSRGQFDGSVPNFQSPMAGGGGMSEMWGGLSPEQQQAFGQMPQRPERPEFDREAFRALEGRDARQDYRSDWRDQMGQWRDDRRDWRGDMRDWRQQGFQQQPQASSYGNLGSMMQRLPEQGMPGMRQPVGWNSQPGL